LRLERSTGRLTAVFRDASDNPMSAAAFFAAVSAGDVIEASTDAPAA